MRGVRIPYDIRQFFCCYDCGTRDYAPRLASSRNTSTKDWRGISLDYTTVTRDAVNALLAAKEAAYGVIEQQRTLIDGHKVREEMRAAAKNFEEYCEDYIPLVRSLNDRLHETKENSTSCCYQKLKNKSTNAQNATLTAIDGSYIAFGDTVGKTVLVVDSDCADCLIYVQLFVDAITATTFTISDGPDTVDSKNFTAPRFFGPKVTVDLQKNYYSNYVLSFTRTTEKSTSPNPQAHTFFCDDDEPIFSVDVKDVSSNCTVELYLSGIPGSDDGKEKYRLMHFNSTTLIGYMTSYVRSPAATFLVPAGCNATLIVKPTTEADVVAPKPVPQAWGWVMSHEYPGNFAATPANVGHRNLTIESSWKGEAFVGFDFESVDPGSSGSLELYAGAIEMNITKQANRTDIGGLGKQIKLYWRPSADTKSGFLARFAVLTDEPIVASTTRKPQDEDNAAQKPFFFLLPLAYFLTILISYF
ncbi:unnamed protein product, partial [Mesorhabditis spiculigera]